jgi:hypothetical protein
MKQALLTLTMLLAALTVQAQEEPEYRLELGGGAGLVSYQGDFNGNLLRDMQPMGSLVARYKMNPRMAWTMSVGYGQLKGSSENANTWMPQLTENPISFTSKLWNIDLRYEYNFWPFGTGKEYLGARRLTPFMAMGAGLAFFDHVAFQVPIGLGVKYKLKDRLNLTAEWMMHFSGSDKLDGIKDPYDIKSSGLFKNTDCYTTLQVALTYDIWAKCKTCNNDR